MLDLLTPQAYALHPDWLARLARYAAALAKDGLHGLESAVAAWGEGQDDDEEHPDSWLDDIEGTRFPEPVIVGRVAILPYYGITGPSMPWYIGTATERFAMQLLSAADNPDIDEIVIRINSPGGMVHGSAELSDLVYRCRERKRVTAWTVNGLMCSAAYMVGSAASRVYATASAELGSIGVMWAHIDVSGWEKDQGVKVSVLSIPDDKRLGNPHEPLTGEARDKILETFLQPYYEQFVGTVARNRNLSADEIGQKFGGGLTMIAGQAVAAGMIDGVRDWNEYLTTLTGRDTGGLTPARSPVTGGLTPARSPVTGGLTPARSPVTGGLTPARSPTLEATQMNWTIKGKAVLFAADLIESPDAEDAVCTAALRAWCAAKGKEMPADEAGAINLVKPPKAAPAAALPVATLVQGRLESQDIGAAVAQAMAAETTRRNEITARAKLLDVPLDDEAVQAALANPAETPAAFADKMLAKAVQGNKPVGRVEAGTAAADRFVELACQATLLKAGPEMARAAVASGASEAQAAEHLAKLTPGDVRQIREVAGMTFLEMAKEVVKLCGARPAQNSDEAWAVAFLRMAGTDRQQRFAVGHPRIENPLLAETPIHGPGSFPNLMGMIAQRTVTYAIYTAPITFYRWAERWDDSRDFNPQEIVQLSGKTLPDEHIDTRPPQQRTFSETPAWFQVHQYSHGTKLSSRMVIQGQMTAFMRMLILLQMGLERNNNQLVYDLLKNNTTCPIDNVPLFHAGSHVNDITGASSGVPSIAQNKLMRTYLAQQNMPGDTQDAGFTFDAALYGTTHLNDADLQYLERYRVVATQQSNVNPFTGIVEPIYEPYLSDGDPVWYGLSRDPRLLGIVYAYLQGFGPGGNRVTYFDDATQCQSFDFYSSFGTALVNYQKFVRNAGETSS